jgi:hypothetical protein
MQVSYFHTALLLGVYPTLKSQGGENGRDLMLTIEEREGHNIPPTPK